MAGRLLAAARTVTDVRRITVIVEAGPMPNETAHTSSDAFAILELPDLEALTDAQTRGVECVWDRAPLALDTAVDLGERMSPLASTGTDMRWFPQACPTCIQALALHTLYGHAPMCEQCVDDAGSCDTGIALRRLAREYR